MLSLGGGRLTSPPPPQKKRVLGSLPALQSGYTTAIMVGVFFAHLLILEYSDQHQNLISYSLYYPWPIHKISLQSIHNFLQSLGGEKLPP